MHIRTSLCVQYIRKFIFIKNIIIMIVILYNILLYNTNIVIVCSLFVFLYYNIIFYIILYSWGTVRGKDGQVRNHLKPEYPGPRYEIESQESRKHYDTAEATKFRVFLEERVPVPVERIQAIYLTFSFEQSFEEYTITTVSCNNNSNSLKTL